MGSEAAKDRLGDEGIYDLHYNDLVSNSIESMRKLYDWLGDDFTPEVEQRMQKWLQEHPQNKFGKHKYSLEEFGLSMEKLKPLFGEYVERYNVPTALTT